MGSQRVRHAWATELNWMEVHVVDLLSHGMLAKRIGLGHFTLSDSTLKSLLPLLTQMFPFLTSVHGGFLKIKKYHWMLNNSEGWNTNVFSTGFCLFCFWLLCAACGILVSWPGIEPTPPAVEAWSLNHWTTREVLFYSSVCKLLFSFGLWDPLYRLWGIESYLYC